MAGTFDVFRKNQKLVMAILCVVLIFGWLIGDAILKIFVGSGPSAADRRGAAVATWKYGSISQSDMSDMRYRDMLLKKYVYQQVPEKIDPRFRLNIRPASDDALLAQMLLAKKGEQLGIKVSDKQVNEFLRHETARARLIAQNAMSPRPLPEQFIDQMLQSGNFVAEMAATDTQMMQALRDARLSQAQLFDIIKKQLIASEVQTMLMFGLSSPWATPAERFEEFQKKEQRYTIEAVPVNVKDFLDTVDTKGMTDAELKKLYEENKDKEPSDGQVGFRIPYKASFQYFRANLADFILQAEATITDKEIEDYYASHKDEFIDKPKEEPKKDETKPTDEKKPEAEKKPETPAEPKKEEPKPETKPDDAGFPKPDVKPNDTEPKTEPKAEPKTEPKPEPKDAPKTEPAPDKNVGIDRNATQFVTFFQDGDKKDATPEKTDEPKKTDPPADLPKGENLKDGDKPSSETKPATPDKKDEPAKTDGEKKEEPKPEVKYKPLADVKADIRRKLAAPIAEKRAREAFAKLQDEITEHGAKRRSWKLDKAADKKTEEPLSPNFADQGKALGLQFAQIPLSTALEFSAASDIGAARFPRGLSVQELTYVNFAYSQEDKLPQYTPREVENTGFMYLIWKTDEVAAHTPSFDDAKASVEQAWKNAAAVKLAQAQADKLLGIAKDKKDLPLYESLGKAQANTVVKVGPFSWRTQLGNADRYSISKIDAISDPGNDFMQAVYNLNVGQAGVAWNQPKTTVYVIKVVAIEKKLEEMLPVFLAQVNQYRFGDYEDRQKVFGQWLDSIKQEFNFKIDDPKMLRTSVETVED